MCVWGVSGGGWVLGQIVPAQKFVWLCCLEVHGSQMMFVWRSGGGHLKKWEQILGTPLFEVLYMPLFEDKGDT